MPAQSKYSPALKMEIVQAVLDGRSVVELAAERQISHSLIYGWLARFRETGSVEPVRATASAPPPQARAAKKKRGSRPRKPAPGSIAPAPPAPVRQRQLELIHAEPELDLRTQLADRDAEIDRLRRAVKALRAAMDALLE